MACRIVSCVSKGGVSLPVDSRHNRPPRVIALASAVSKLRFGFASLACCPPYAISDGGFAALRQFDKFDKFDKFVI